MPKKAKEKIEEILEVLKNKRNSSKTKNVAAKNVATKSDVQKKTKAKKETKNTTRSATKNSALVKSADEKKSNKKSTAKKTDIKEDTEKKPTTKKATNKNTNTKNTEKNETTNKKATTKATAKKTSAEKTTTKATKKVSAEKTATKTATKKPSAEKTTTKSTKKSSAKRTSTKATNKKISAEKNTTKATQKTSVRKATTKKTTTKKASTKKVPAKKISFEEYYDLPNTYEQTIVKILAQTPTILFVYWEVSSKDKNNFIKEYGENFFSETSPYLIVINKDKNYQFEVEINDYANSWYLHIPDSDCKYEVILIRKNKNSQILPQNSITITSSNQIEAPNDHILFEKLGKNIFFKDVKTGYVQEKDISSFAFMHNIGRIYNIYDLYKEIYKNELNGDELGIKLYSSQSSSNFK